MRTIDRYRRRASRGGALPARGRPQLPMIEQQRIRALVEEAGQGLPAAAGWRTYAKRIEAQHPGERCSVQYVQREVARRKRRQHEQDLGRGRAIARRRIGHDLLARDAVWGEDSTLVGWTEEGALYAELLRDAATTKVLDIAFGAALTVDDVIALLERTRAQRGGPPLIWQSDNGPLNTARRTQDYLAGHRIVWLPSRTHTSTDNAGTERAIGELKADGALLRGARILDPLATVALLQRECARRNGALPRASRGWWTADELDTALPRADRVVDRGAFYEAACSARRKALRGMTDVRKARAAERAAVLDTLVRFGLARRRLGPQRLARVHEPRAALAPIG